MDERSLIETLQKIEALHAGATTAGERAAAANARDRILARLAASAVTDPPVEYRFALPDPWERQMFLALARRYGLVPYQLHGQHRQTVMLRVPKRFVDDTLWPEFTALASALTAHLAQVTNRVIHEAIHADSSEAEERKAPRALT